MSDFSKTPNAVLMSRARESLKGKWGLGVGVTAFWFVLCMLVGAIAGEAGSLAQLLVAGAIAVGMAEFYLNIARGRSVAFGQIFEGFKRFGIALATYLLMMLFILLWALLLIVPGILAALSYSLTWYVMTDDAALGPLEAMNRSKAMMYGHRWKLTCLGFRFFGWFLLCVLTLGIGLLWLLPYVGASMAHFYEDIKKGSEPAIVSVSDEAVLA
jgi:uncharacterized membrane protein